MEYRYIYGNGHGFENQLLNLFLKMTFDSNLIPVRIVFFGSASDARQYRRDYDIIESGMSNCFGEQGPVWSYVAQHPLEGNLAAEIQQIEPCEQILYRSLGGVPYMVTLCGPVKSLYIGGVRADAGLTIEQQSDVVFDKIRRIFQKEEMSISSIVRQWNYIEHITQVNRGVQNYQGFNDSRARFYAGQDWSSGYPAATGIGTAAGGVVVELDAMTGVRIAAVDNNLQVAAHDYSQQVLIGDTLKPKATPKFERAKLAGDVFYISGTAAIRGEYSLANENVERQTTMTLENIEYLLDKVNLRQIDAMRVYLKQADYLDDARSVVSQRCPYSQALYVVADICRPELLVEIEGVAYAIDC